MIDQEKIREAVSSILVAIGDDPNREGLVGTPDRVARMYADFFSGLCADPSEALNTGFDEAHDDTVILRDIPFFSICEHHLLPFFGSAHIGYIPAGRVVGASKLARALDTLARRPQLQERLTNQLADVIYDTVNPEGVAVVIGAEHLCMSLRGVKKQGSKILTTASRGSLRTKSGARHDFFRLLGEI